MKLRLMSHEASEGSKVNPFKPPVSHNHKENQGHGNLSSASTLLSNDFHVQCIFCNGLSFLQ